MTTNTQFHNGIATGALLSLSLLPMTPALAQGPWSYSANIGAVSNYIWRGVTQTDDGAAIQGGLDVAHESGFYAGTWASNIDWDGGGSQGVVGIVPVDDAGNPLTDADGNLLVVGETAGEDPNSPNYELDFYAGYGYAINDDLSIDLNTIYYAYPDGRDSDFWEIGASATYKWFTLGLAYTAWGENDGGPFTDGDFYYFGSAEFALPYDFSVGLRTGYYDFHNDQDEIGVLTDNFGAPVLVNGNPVMQTETLDYWHWGVSVSKEAGDFGTFSLNYDQNDGETLVGYDNDPKVWVSWLKEF